MNSHLTSVVPLWNRRKLLLASAAAAGSLVADSVLSQRQGLAAPEQQLPWIDAHSHIWPAETDHFPLVPGLTTKDIDPPSFDDEQLMDVARPEGVGRVVLIQHSVYHLFDNSYLIDAVKRHPQRFRVVGMVDDAKDDAGEAMQKLLSQGVTGFRITPFIRENQPAGWLETTGMKAMWKMGAATRQAMCCLINPHDLPAVDAMCERYPETPVVIDHFARIGMDGQIRPADLDQLCRLERHRHTYVKLSAYYALGEKKPPHLELVPMIRRLYETFGPQRLMWASDSPYQLQGVNTYRDSISLVRDRIDFLTAEDRQWLLRKTAEQVFFFV